MCKSTYTFERFIPKPKTKEVVIKVEVKVNISKDQGNSQNPWLKEMEIVITSDNRTRNKVIMEKIAVSFRSRRNK